jgi:hypothetical protein
METSSAALASDLQIVTHDYEESQVQIANMTRALEAVEKEFDGKARKLESQYRDKLERLNMDWLRRRDEDKEAMDAAVAAAKSEASICLVRLEEEALLRKKMQMEMSAEKQQMNGTLQRALNQMQHSSEDTVNRLLVRNLLVNYFERGRCDLYELLYDCLHYKIIFFLISN